METSLINIVQQSNLDKTKAEFILKKFCDYSAIAEEWKQKASALVITNELQVDEMKMAREGRLVLKSKRVEIEKTRKELKEQSLREGKAIDGIAKYLTGLIEPIETYLDMQERFVEIQQEKIRIETKKKRDAEIAPYLEFTPQPIDTGLMTEEAFWKLLAYVKNQKKEVEAEREVLRAKEKAEAEERERIRIENEKLKEENKKQAAKIEAEILFQKEIQAKADADKAKAKAISNKAIADAKAKADQLAAEIRAKAEAEEKAKRDADAKAAAELKAKQLAEKKAAAAPDKTKLNDFAKMLDELTLPELKSEQAKEVVEYVGVLLKRISVYIKEETEKM